MHRFELEDSGSCTSNYTQAGLPGGFDIVLFKKLEQATNSYCPSEKTWGIVLSGLCTFRDWAAYEPREMSLQVGVSNDFCGSIRVGPYTLYCPLLHNFLASLLRHQCQLICSTAL